MLGKKLKKEWGDKPPNKLDEVIAKMEAALERGDFEILPQLMEEFNRKFDLQMKGGFLGADDLKRYSRILKRLEELAKKKKEELIQEEQRIKKLKSYGEYGG
jgi:hypothetical protein